jgi:hypothetical protein
VALQNVPNQHCELSFFLARCNWRFNVCKKKRVAFNFHWKILYIYIYIYI